MRHGSPRSVDIPNFPKLKQIVRLCHERVVVGGQVEM